MVGTFRSGVDRYDMDELPVDGADNSIVSPSYRHG
jgi:hypothetical protein